MGEGQQFGQNKAEIVLTEMCRGFASVGEEGRMEVPRKSEMMCITELAMSYPGL